MMKYLQKLGKALMLPVAVLPICGILMGLGYALAPGVMGVPGAATSGAASASHTEPSVMRSRLWNRSNRRLLILWNAAASRFCSFPAVSRPCATICRS